MTSLRRLGTKTAKGLIHPLLQKKPEILHCCCWAEKPVITLNCVIWGSSGRRKFVVHLGNSSYTSRTDHLTLIPCWLEAGWNASWRTSSLPNKIHIYVIAPSWVFTSGAWWEMSSTVAFWDSVGRAGSGESPGASLKVSGWACLINVISLHLRALEG